MRREIALWKVLVALVALLAVSSGSAVALAGSGSPTAQAPPDSRGILTPTRSTTYVPVTPCRIFSTAATSTPVAPGATRTLKVYGNLASQGGQAAGCGIPVAASAVEVAVSATANQGAGYVRAWPAGQSEPQATFLNYTAAGATTNTGTLAVTAGGANALMLKNYLSTTHLIMDVQGYYVRSMYALINANGSLQGYSRLTSVSKVGTGQYRLSFEIDTDACVRTVTVGRHRTTDPSSSGFASAHITETPAHQVTVTTYDTAGTLADRPFMLEITC